MKKNCKRIPLQCLRMWSIFICLIFLVVGLGCNRRKDVSLRKDASFHLTKFLDFEFGKTYSKGIQSLPGRWFGYDTVYLYSMDEPLYGLDFQKGCIGLLAKEKFSELVSAFESKYNIKFSQLETPSSLSASYDGKYTRIDILFSCSSKAEIKYSTDGTLNLMIRDVQLMKEWEEKYDKEKSQRKLRDVDRM